MSLAKATIACCGYLRLFTHPEMARERPHPPHGRGVLSTLLQCGPGFGGQDAQIQVAVFSMRTILLAEDRESSRELIRTVLEHAGFAVIEASNGAEAVAMAREKSPDLILLDLEMPVKGGFEALQELRADVRFQSIPVVALTASAMYGDRQKASEHGFTSYLTKPLNLVTFRQELARLLPA